MTTRSSPPLRPLTLPASIAQHLYADAKAQANALADRIARRLRNAIDERGQASLLVPGGSTPTALFNALSQQPLDWSRVLISLTDERCVDADHVDANAGLIQRELRRNAAIAARFAPLWIPGDEDPLRAAHDAWQHVLPPLDMVVLGMGADGHFASLFPGCAELPAALDTGSRPAALLMRPANAAHPRISFNLSALLSCRHCVVLIRGEDKARVLEQAAHSRDRLRWPVAALIDAAEHGAPIELHAC